MKLVFKLLSLSFGFASIGGASYGIHYFLSDNSIKKLLKEKGYTLLNFEVAKEDDHETWKPIIKAYSNSGKKINNLTITPIQTNNSPTSQNINDFKKECGKLIDLNNYSETNLKIAEQFCVTPITIKALLEKSRTILHSTEGESSPWDNKVSKYLLSSTNKQFLNVNLTTPSEKKGKRDPLKNACDTIGAKKTYDNDCHTKLSKFLEWCTNPK